MKLEPLDADVNEMAIPGHRTETPIEVSDDGDEEYVEDVVNDFITVYDEDTNVS